MHTSVKTTLDLDIGGDYISYPVVFDFGYKKAMPAKLYGHPDSWREGESEEFYFENVKLEVGDNIWATLDDEYICGDIYKVLVEYSKHYLRLNL